MIKIVNKAKCCGCTACENICPKKCITLIPDEEGFLYPSADESKCSQCGLCEKVCPMLNPPKFTRHTEPATFVAQTKNDSILPLCASGGVVTTLARHLVRQNWYIAGVAYDEEFKVIHGITNEENRIDSFAGSKYVQSDLGNVFTAVQGRLKSEESVLFCGTPCQVAGLRRFLDRDYDNLITIDLACHGVPSPLLWEKYVEYIEKKHGRLKRVNFRSKRFGYHVTVMEETHDDGKSYFGSARTNLMSKIFFSNIADRMSCYRCPFKTVNRISDLTVYDSWHASDLAVGLRDNDKGYTNVIVQSEKGKRLLDQCSELFFLRETSTEKAVELDGSMMTQSTKIHPGREQFYPYLMEHGIELAVKKFLPISKMDRIIDKTKGYLNGFGILRRIKTIRDSLCH